MNGFLYLFSIAFSGLLQLTGRIVKQLNTESLERGLCGFKSWVTHSFSFPYKANHITTRCLSFICEMGRWMASASQAVLSGPSMCLMLAIANSYPGSLLAPGAFLGGLAVSDGQVEMAASGQRGFA